MRDHGAVPDGKTLCTLAIQKAIDRCAAGGGGTVYVPPGDWLSGAIELRSHVTLELDAGCRDRPAKTVPEREDAYPGAEMLGALPAWGIYCRHVVGLTLRDLWLQTAKPDLRQILSCDDVKDLVVDGLAAQQAACAAAPLQLIQCPGAKVRNAPTANAAQQ